MTTSEVIGCEGRISKLRGLLAIDVRMIPIKINYLLYGGMLGSHIPFLNLFFLSVGLSATQAGLIIGIRFAPSSIVGPMWGMLADYSGRRKLILILLCLGAVPLFSMPWVSRVIYPNVTIQTNTTVINQSVSSISDTMFTFRYDHNVDTKAKNTLFYTLFAIMMFSSLFLGPLPGYVDSIVMSVIKTSENKPSYGVQRIFGSLGFSFASFVCGVLADNYNQPHMSKYTAVFFLYLPYTLLMIPFGYYLIGQARWDNTDNENRTERVTTSSNGRGMMVLHMFSNPDVIVFTISVLISGLAINLFQNFSLLFVGDVMTVSETEKSLIVVIATTAEVLIFPFTSSLIRILGGTFLPITLGIFSYFIRFLVMSYTTQLWLMLFVQTLHGFGFALIWAAVMEYIHEVTPKEILLTMFLILQSIHFGVAALLSITVGGHLYQLYGGRALFRGKAVICGVWTALMVIYYGSKRIKNKYNHRKKASIECKFRTHRSKEMGEDNDLGFDNTEVSITHCN